MRSSRLPARRSSPDQSPLRVIRSPEDAPPERDLPGREGAEITARGSHMRRVRRRAPRPRAHAEPVFSRAMIAWRLAVAGVVLAAFAALLAHGIASLLLAAETPSIVSIGLTAFGLVASSWLALTLFHAWRYRAVAAYPDAALPRVTLIVPAYNEGPAVRVALESALASDYPEDLLEIVAVDDGSTDDTWAHVEAVARAHEDRVIAIRMPANGGKRAALREGFERGTAPRSSRR